jgi:hypothetical protein
MVSAHRQRAEHSHDEPAVAVHQAHGADLSVDAGLRWGQIHGLGGGEKLARAIIGTRLGTDFSHDEFWITVLRFFIANAEIEPAHVGPIIDYIHHHRFVGRDEFAAPGVFQGNSPAQPNLTMKGRTPTSLLRQVISWHRRLANAQHVETDWARSGINDFQLAEGTERSGNLKIWTITELLSTKALVAEGRTMKHCVASYAHLCARGACSIWTLEVTTLDGRAKVLTIEVRHGSRLIAQARGKCNMLPTEKHRGILRRWAEIAGLCIAKHV